MPASILEYNDSHEFGTQRVVYGQKRSITLPSLCGISFFAQEGICRDSDVKMSMLSLINKETAM